MNMSALPHWDLSSIYPSLESELFIADMKNLETLATQLEKQLSQVELLDASSLQEILETYQKLFDTASTLYAYTQAIVTVNTNDEFALRKLGDVEKALLDVRAKHVKLLSFLAHHQKEIQPLIKKGGDVHDYRYALEELLQEQSHTLSEKEESLAADLNRSGTDAWSRLQEAISSNASTIWDEKKGIEKTVIQLRSLAFDPDRSIRKKAFEKELSIWKQHEIAFASALNGVKGTTITLDGKRGYASPLERSMIDSRIDQTILDALIGTIEQNLEVFRRYLRAKANYLGVPSLAFYDLFAPVGKHTTTYSYAQAQTFIVKEFTRFHPPMGSFAQEAFDRNWIDSEPRSGKVGGAYCTSFPLRQESRILANYDYTFDGLSTIAHELGHAYHDHVTNSLPYLLRQYPMTLAETASIFSQVVIFQGALQDADVDASLSLIESFLQDSTQVCVDILSRYYFEKNLFEKREKGELLAKELSQLMIDAQKASYGDSLDESALHPYMWAVKGHYYRSDLSFYNYPYAFGQLFGLGVYHLAQQEGDSFGSRYDELLRHTGRSSAQDVASTVGIDITKASFWQQGIDLISSYVDQFCNLVGYSE